MTRTRRYEWAVSSPATKAGGYRHLRSGAMSARRADELLDLAHREAEGSSRGALEAGQRADLRGDHWIGFVRMVREGSGGRLGREVAVIVGPRDLAPHEEIEIRGAFAAALDEALTKVDPKSLEVARASVAPEVDEAFEGQLLLLHRDETTESTPRGPSPLVASPRDNRSARPGWRRFVVLGALALSTAIVLYLVFGRGSAETDPDPESSLDRALAVLGPEAHAAVVSAIAAGDDTARVEQSLFDRDGRIQPFALTSRRARARLRTLAPSDLEPILPQDFGAWLARWKQTATSAQAALLAVERLRDAAPDGALEDPQSPLALARGLLQTADLGQLAWISLDACRDLTYPAPAEGAPGLPSDAEVEAVADLHEFLTGCGDFAWDGAVTRDPATGVPLRTVSTIELLHKVGASLVGWQDRLQQEWYHLGTRMADIPQDTEEHRRLRRWVDDLYVGRSGPGRLGDLCASLAACAATMPGRPLSDR